MFGFFKKKPTDLDLELIKNTPGAGKSSLLECLEKFGNGETNPVVVSVPLRILENTPEAVRKIGERVLRHGGRELDQETELATQGEIGAAGWAG